eukprot:CAMPEP_0119475292 /NCGR_PEP_ID=MMETSP1344-20130328/6230_1 /TAXON_ID=236787 /ORGANISM="Florenciella parvula, Strain CCMP2471" /LENGTH=62 /DNA_ID=CAMNT_0007508773 /DNA_START=460 /DNA_END=648 /DNA_ORIENTATION=+
MNVTVAPSSIETLICWQQVGMFAKTSLKSFVLDALSSLLSKSQKLHVALAPYVPGMVSSPAM